MQALYTRGEGLAPAARGDRSRLFAHDCEIVKRAGLIRARSASEDMAGLPRWRFGLRCATRHRPLAAGIWDGHSYEAENQISPQLVWLSKGQSGAALGVAGDSWGGVRFHHGGLGGKEGSYAEV